MTSRHVDSVSCTYQGLVYVFARDLQAADPATIVFNVLNLQVNSSSDDQDWVGFSPVTFPDQVRPAGMSLIQVPTAVSAKLAPASAPFRVVSDDVYLYFFRPSKAGTLLVNRMRAIKTFDVGTQTDRFTVVPAWEVRFRQSGKIDVPAGALDVQGYTARDGEPFQEPTIELWFVNDVVDGCFDAALVQAATGTRWHIFVPSAKTLRHYSLKSDSRELFDLSDKVLDSRGTIQPTNAIGLKTMTGASHTLRLAPSAALYAKRELMQTADGDEVTTMRAVRLAVAQPVSGPAIAMLDFGVGVDGELVQLGTNANGSSDLNVPEVLFANQALYFDRFAYVSLPNVNGTLAIKGAFELDLWLRPSDLVPPIQLILGDDEDDAKKRSVFLEMVDAGRLALGFGDGCDGVRAVTTERVLRKDAWAHVQASFTLGEATNSLSIKVNGTSCPIDQSTTNFTPEGSPLSRVSRAKNGFIGTIEQVVITSDGKQVVNLPFDTVDFTVVPPSTPDISGVNNTGALSGARQLPSDAPIVQIRDDGLYVDANGLRLVCGLLSFAMSDSSPWLLSGKDGLLHLYFQESADCDRPNGIGVAQYDTRTARATFSLPWEAGSQGVAESGTAVLVSRAAGALMNAASVKVTVPASPTGAAVADLYDLEFTLSDANQKIIAQEKWTGVPRRLQDLELVLAGRSVAEPDDAGIQTGAKVFFDNGRRYQMALVPLDVEQRYAFLNFVSRFPERLPLSRVVLTSDGDGAKKRKAVLTFGVTKAGWPEADKQVTQTWSGLPNEAGLFQRTLNALDTTYDYDKSAKISALACFLALASRQGSGQLVVLIHESLTKLNVAVSDSDEPTLCTVSLSAVVGGKKLKATLGRVPRDNAKFATVLDGTADETDYDYHNNAQDDWSRLCRLLLPLPNGIPGQILNRVSGALPPADMRAAASLFSLFQSGDVATSAIVPASFNQDATARMSAVDKDGKALPSGSRLFALSRAALPVNGYAPLIQPTLTEEARLLTSGVDGGWICQPPQNALKFTGAGEIQFDKNATAALFLDRDMTVEAWFQAAALVATSSQARQRIVNFNGKGKPGDPNAVSRYALGVVGSAALKFTSVESWFGHRSYPHYIEEGEPVSLELWVCFDAGQTGTIATLASPDNTLALLLSNESSGLKVTYFSNSSIGPVPCLTPAQWNYVVVTIEPRLGGEAKIALFANGELIKEEIVTYKPLEIVALALGHEPKLGVPLCLPGLLANGVSLWNVALTPENVRTGYNQGLPDDSRGLLIRWKLAEGNDATLRNYGSTGPQDDCCFDQSVFFNRFAWSGPGIYTIVHFSCADTAIAALVPNCVNKWHHLAASYRCGTALHFDGHGGAVCPYNESLNTPDCFSFEAWIAPAVSSNQVIAEKNGSWILQLREDGSITLEVITNVEGRPCKLNNKDKVNAEELVYIVATVSTHASEPTPGNATASYYAPVNLYVNGELKDSNIIKSTVPISVAASKMGLSVGCAADRTFGYHGSIAHVRLWRRELSAEEIAEAFNTRSPSENTDGLISFWTFSEMEGRVASDQGNVNRLFLSSTELWARCEPLSTMQLLIDGRPAGTADRLSAECFGGYGDQQFTIGSCRGAPSVTGLQGAIDEIRLWSKVRTAEQIADAAYCPLLGSEAGLAGYWRFDAGSGDQIEDQTGRGADGRIAASPGAQSPAWVVSGAPLSNEGEAVFNVLGGIPTEFNAKITGSPTVVEYVDVQRDAYDVTVSVLKRCYVAPTEYGLRLDPGYMISELDTVRFGQIQTQPTVIGYIEGAPPIPSENQTMPYWDDISNYHAYASATGVKLKFAESVSMEFNTAARKGEAYDFDGKGGLALAAGLDISVEVAGLGLSAPAFSAQATIGPHGTRNSSRDSGKECKLSIARTLNSANALEPGGAWESPDRILNPTVGRRYVPENIGYALVKSGVADLFASRLKDGTLLKLSAVPNVDIPEDVNIITFPIDPQYQKNGVLDGQVGLVKDPSTSNSYFRPLEAYSLKRAVERQEQQIESYYTQFDATAYAREGGFEALGTDSKGDAFFDRSKDLSKRASVNTYVWTAAGGSYAEERSYVDTYCETYGASSSLDQAYGFGFDYSAVQGRIGVYGEFDFLWHTTVELTASKGQEEQHVLELSAQATPDRNLAGFDSKKNRFTDSAAPGKVDAYRYMSVFLPPDSEHLVELFANVVDQQWYKQSQSASAVALRNAKCADNGCWRVRYFVTYVSRVPPSFQPAPDELREPTVKPPANPIQNTVLTHLVTHQLLSRTDNMRAPGLTIDAVSPAQLGVAVRNVLGDSHAPGVLGELLLWWKDYSDKASIYVDPACNALASTREDVLTYMNNQCECAVLQKALRTDVRRLGQRR